MCVCVYLCRPRTTLVGSRLSAFMPLLRLPGLPARLLLAVLSVCWRNCESTKRLWRRRAVDKRASPHRASTRRRRGGREAAVGASRMNGLGGLFSPSETALSRLSVCLSILSTSSARSKDPSTLKTSLPCVGSPRPASILLLPQASPAINA